MSLITRFLNSVTDPDLKLARDLTAMAIADGEVTPEERKAMSVICHLEGVDEAKLLENLNGGYEHVDEEMPTSYHAREDYLRNIIKLIGADGYAAPQEVFLFQIIASKMGLKQTDVISMFLMIANRRYFVGDVGNRVMTSFLRSCINPKGKTEAENRTNLSKIYHTVAIFSEVTQDEDLTREIMRQNLARATEVFLENKILVKEFDDMKLNFARMLKEEELKVYKKMR